MPFASRARGLWLQESITEFIRQAAEAAAAAHGWSRTVITSVTRLTKAWVRKGLQKSSGDRKGYEHLKGYQIELLVLKAAQVSAVAGVQAGC